MHDFRVIHRSLICVYFDKKEIKLNINIAPKFYLCRFKDNFIFNECLINVRLVCKITYVYIQRSRDAYISYSSIYKSNAPEYKK